MTVRQRLYQAIRHGETYTGPVWSADLLAMLQRFDNQAKLIKERTEELVKLAACTEKLLFASAEHADGYLEPEARTDCRAALNKIYTGSIEKESKKMDDHLAEARARLSPDKRYKTWSASANRMVASVFPDDIDIVLAALTDVEKRLNAALELNRIGGSHTYHCKSGTGHGGCDDECARLRKVMLGADV